jgi:hypothetical protein
MSDYRRNHDMRGIANIYSPLAPPPLQGVGNSSNSSQSGGGFQMATLGRSLLASPSAQGVSATATSSLGAQTVSTLLQTQDLSQIEEHGGGGGGHRGGMKMMAGLEAEEEAAESEEAQNSQRRRKLTKLIKSSTTAVTNEVDENGIVIEADVEQSEATTPKRKDAHDPEMSAR